MLSACTPSCCLTCSACSLVELFVHVGVDQLADAATDGIHQTLDEVLLNADTRLGSTQRSGRICHRRHGRVDNADDLFQIREVIVAVGQGRDVERVGRAGNREVGTAVGGGAGGVENARLVGGIEQLGAVHIDRDGADVYRSICTRK